MELTSNPIPSAHPKSRRSLPPTVRRNPQEMPRRWFDFCQGFIGRCFSNGRVRNGLPMKNECVSKILEMEGASLRIDAFWLTSAGGRLIKRGGKETPYKFVTTVWSYRVLFLPYHFQSFLHSSRVYTFFVGARAGAGCRLPVVKTCIFCSSTPWETHAHTATI